MQLSFHNGRHLPPPQGLTAMRIHRGMGATDQQITALFGSIGSMVPVAGPFIAAAASVAIAIENLFAGCGQTCVQTSNAANQAEVLLKQNLNNYLSQPIHYASIQQAALIVFDHSWASLMQLCSNPQYGTAGQNCISNRQAGACQWKSSAYGWTQDSTGKWTYVQSGPAGSGSQCWNWFSGYRDPIANDPTVVPDPVVAGVDTMTGAVVGPTGSAGAADSSSSLMPLLLMVGAVLLLVEVA